MINCKAETAGGKPSFRSLVNRKRCVVVSDGFYEWQRLGDGSKKNTKQAFFIHPIAKKQEGKDENKDRPLLYLAGLYDTWRPKLEDGSWSTNEDDVLYTCAILTTQPTQEFASIHDRMPVILQDNDIDTWLDVKANPYNSLQKLLSPYKDNNLNWYKVSDTVNSIKNQTPDCMVPLEDVMAKRRANGIGKFFGAAAQGRAATKPNAVGEKTGPEKNVTEATHTSNDTAKPAKKRVADEAFQTETKGEVTTQKPTSSHPIKSPKSPTAKPSPKSTAKSTPEKSKKNVTKKLKVTESPGKQNTLGTFFVQSSSEVIAKGKVIAKSEPAKPINVISAINAHDFSCNCSCGKPATARLIRNPNHADFGKKTFMCGNTATPCDFKITKAP